MDVMAELGTDLFFVCANTSPQSTGSLERIAEDLYALGEHARQRGFRVGFVALAWSKHIHDYRDAWEVVRRANHPVVGLVLDAPPGPGAPAPPTPPPGGGSGAAGGFQKKLFLKVFLSKLLLPGLVLELWAFAEHRTGLKLGRRWVWVLQGKTPAVQERAALGEHFRRVV